MTKLKPVLGTSYASSHETGPACATFLGAETEWNVVNDNWIVSTYNTLNWNQSSDAALNEIHRLVLSLSFTLYNPAKWLQEL